MRSLTKPAYALIIIAILCALLLLNSVSAVAKTHVENVVERYMSNLFSGNIAEIEQCLGNDFRKRRENTFKDPTYSNFLKNRYDGATYRILQTQIRKNGQRIVDVEITFRTSEGLRLRLLLDSSNKIVDEIIL